MVVDHEKKPKKIAFHEIREAPLLILDWNTQLKMRLPKSVEKCVCQMHLKIFENLIDCKEIGIQINDDNSLQEIMVSIKHKYS